MTDTADQPVHPGVRPGDHHVRARPGHRAVGRHRQALPRLPRRPGGDLARPRQPGGRRRPDDAEPHAVARQQPVRQRRCSCNGPQARPSCSPRSPARTARCSSATAAPRPTRRALKLARKFGGRGRHAVDQRLRQLPRPHAGDARRHRPAGQARAVLRRCPTASATSCSTTSTRSTAAVDPSVGAVLLEPIQGEGGVIPRRSRLPARRARPVRRARPAADHGRGADRHRAASGRGSGSSTPAIVPDVVTMAKAHRQRRSRRRGVGQARCRRRVPARRPRQHVQRHGAGHRGGRAR